MTNWDQNNEGLIKYPSAKRSKEYWLEKARAAQQLLAKLDANPLLKYRPCCAVHGGRKPDDWSPAAEWFPAPCPTNPCPESKHVKFHMSRKRVRFVLGGNRSSKTFTCMQEFLFRMCLKKHPFTGEAFRPGDRHGRVLAQDYATHEKKHIPEIRMWIPQSVLKGGKSAKNKNQAWERSYDSRNHVLHLVNNGWIDFLTYDQDTSKGESVDLDVWFADEEMPEEWYDACNSRIVSRSGIGILGVTPLYGLSWAIRLIDSADPNIEKFQWSIWDNPHNSSKSIKEFLAQASEGTRESREDGTLMDFKGLRYKDLRPDVHLLDPRQPEPYWPVVCAVDPHQRKGTYIVWAYVNPHDQVVFFDELHVQGNVREVVAKIHERERTHKARTLIRLIDPAADKQVEGYGEDISTLDSFEEAGMSFTLAFNGRAGYDVVEEYITHDEKKPAMVYWTRNCEKTWYAMTRLMWDEWRPSQRSSRDVKERVKDKGKDFPDCVRYVLAFRPSYSSGDTTPVNLNYQIG